MKRICLLALPALLLVLLVAAPAAPARSSVKRCSVPSGFMTGPFFADALRVRAVSCANGRTLVKKWGRTKDCVMPSGGPSDTTCKVGRYRCVYRRKGGEGSELARSTCKRRGTRKAVGFDFGS